MDDNQTSSLRPHANDSMGFKVRMTKHTISSLNMTKTPIAQTARMIIASTTMTYETVDFLVVDQIHSRSIPTRPIHMKSLSVPSNLELADPTFHIPQNVDLLLGVTIFWDILEVDRIELGAKQPILQLTKLR